MVKKFFCAATRSVSLERFGGFEVAVASTGFARPLGSVVCVGLVLFVGLVGCASEPNRNWTWATEAVPADLNIGVEAYEVAKTPGDDRDYLNPGAEAFDGNVFATVRTDINPWSRARRGCGWERAISIGVLNEAGQFAGPLQPLALPRDTGCDTAEDARLIACGGALYAVFNAEIAKKRAGRQRQIRMFLAQLDVSDREQMHVMWSRQLQTPLARQDQDKNWSPFCYNNTLHFVYTILPHTVIELSEDKVLPSQPAVLPRPQRFPPAKMAVVAKPEGAPSLNWAGGPPRGGTPAIFEPMLGEYVGVFQSHLEVGKHRLYYVGIYTFAAEPPFAIQRYTQAPIGLPAVSDRYDKWFRVLFPVGLIDRGDSYAVTYGQDNSTAGLAYIDKRSLFARLTPVSF